ncbi:DUF2937 family protein [uncultured Devosia sp.]|uniref:DUF2937 family protein n=1 Tax=uncultured Devosia sp. TaxID=211434 RepID=UPI0035C9E5C4
MRRVVAGIGGVALAVALSQFPEYAQQYTQRLGGAVDELRIVTEKFDRDATAAGLDRQQALTRFEASPDTFLAGRGISEAANFARYEQLSATLARIRNADAIERFQLLPAFFDTDIGARTLENYQPAVPVTVEGILYAGGGLLVGYLLMSGIWRFLAMPFRRRYPAYR